MREIEAQFNMISYKEFAMAHGFDENGKVQQYFTDKVFEFSRPYTPSSGIEDGPDGALLAEVVRGPDYILYNSIYADYLWNGKKFIDPIYKVGAFPIRNGEISFDESKGVIEGFVSRKGVLKEQTDTDLNYNGAPMRGPKWIDRMWADKDEEIIMLTERYANRGDLSE